MAHQTKTNDVSAFLEKKARAYFTVTDYNKKGFVTREDYLTMADAFSTKYGIVDSQRREEIRRVILNEWKHVSKSYGGKDSGPVTVDALIKSWKLQVNNDEVKKDCFEQFNIFMDSINQDGYVTRDEFVRFYGGFDVSDSERVSKFAFDAIDVNGYGKLSKEELTEGFVHFLTSDDESSPYKYFLGPLE